MAAAPPAGLLPAITADPGVRRPAGAWQPRLLGPGDAFGQSGRYDRAAVARLYGAQRPIVVRGPRRTDAGTTEMWTLISPYPDAELQSLQPGTLLIVLEVP